MTATLLHGDCLELMKTLPDKSVDCFICDLPYGQLSKDGIELDPSKTTHGHGTPSSSGCPWDVKLNLTEFWTQVKRLCKNDHTPVLMFCNTKFGFELYNSNPSWFRYDLVWDKARGVSFLSANKMPLKSHEMVYVFSKKGAFYKRVDIQTDKKGWKAKQKEPGDRCGIRTYEKITKGWKCNENNGTRCALSVIQVVRPHGPGQKRHPTEKPLELYKWLLERYCPEGGTVLDPTAGSFNSILAARELKLKGIDIEKDDKFYEEGCKKFKASAPIPVPTELRNELVLTPAAITE